MNQSDKLLAQYLELRALLYITEDDDCNIVAPDRGCEGLHILLQDTAILFPMLDNVETVKGENRKWVE